MPFLPFFLLKYRSVDMKYYCFVRCDLQNLCNIQVNLRFFAFFSLFGVISTPIYMGADGKKSHFFQQQKDKHLPLRPEPVANKTSLQAFGGFIARTLGQLMHIP